MKASEYAYLQLRFPRLLKLGVILFSEAAYYLYALILLLYSDVPIIQKEIPPVYQSLSTAENAIISIIAFAVLLRITKSAIKWIIYWIGVVFYGLFYPKTWASNTHGQSMYRYYRIVKRYNFDELRPL